VISGALFGFVLGLRAWVQWVGPFPGDRYAIDHYSGSHLGLPTWVINSYVSIAEPVTVVVMLLAAIWALWRRVEPRASIGLALAALIIVWNAVLKVAFGATPLWSQAHHIGVNYPSGHTSYVTAVFGYLAWLGARGRQPALVAVCVLIIIGMGPERVLSGTHLVSDVIGGYLLGLAWLILVTRWVRAGGYRGPATKS
jgi:membrane-associated phospholipid phosphatase